MSRNLVAEARRHAAAGRTIQQASELMGVSIQALSHMARSSLIPFPAAERRASNWRKPTTQAGLRDYYTGIKKGLSRWPASGRKGEG